MASVNEGVAASLIPVRMVAPSGLTRNPQRG
jgi:hypothetical protein